MALANLLAAIKRVRVLVVLHLHALTNRWTAYRREVYHCLSLHVHSQHHRSFLQEQIIQLPSVGRVSILWLSIATMMAAYFA